MLEIGVVTNRFNTQFLAGTFLGSGAELDIWGLGFNQNIEKAALDLYVTWRHADAEVSGSRDGTTSGGDATSIEIEPLDIILTGARIQF